MRSAWKVVPYHSLVRRFVGVMVCLRPRPAKGHERRTNKYGGSEVNGETDHDPRPRWSKNHRRAIDRNVEVGGIYRNDLDISPRIDNVIVGVRWQITIAICLLTHSLHSVHYIRPLR